MRSSTFTLGGSGYISFKLGAAQAGLKVFLSDGSPIAEFTNTEFADVSFPNIDEGCRLATMTTFVYDLSEYLGEDMYIELHDLGGGGWGVAMFDDIVTYYETAPDYATKSDTVEFFKKVDDVLEQTKRTADIAWVLAENQIVAHISTPIAGDAINSSDAAEVDLTAYLNSVAVSYGTKVIASTEYTVTITSVSFDGTAITEGFEAFDMSVVGLYTISYTVTYDGDVINGSFRIDVINSNMIKNGGFETGDLAGWTYTEGTDDGEIRSTAVSNADTFFGEKL